MSATLSFSQALIFLKCTPQYLSDQIEAGRVQFTFNGRGKYLLSVRSLRRLNKGPSIPERKREPPKVLTRRVQACRMREMMEEAKLIGMSLEEYRETVLGLTNEDSMVESRG